MTLDEDKDEDNDLTFIFDSLSVVIEKALYASIKNPVIAFDANQGITVAVEK